MIINIINSFEDDVKLNKFILVIRYIIYYKII